MKQQIKKLWFRRKIYGWGWVPVTWQGWLVTAGYVALLLAFGLTLDENSSDREVAFTFLIPLAILTATFIRILYKTGEKPRWQWGPRADDVSSTGSVKAGNMKGYVSNIEKLSLENNNFRKVLYTDKNSQLVLMSLDAGQDIGEEVHDVDQFLRVEQGTGRAILSGVSHDLADGSVIIVPAGTKHNVINSGVGSMKLYTLYMPPHHRDGIIHKTKADAESDTTDEFDGKTTE